MVPRGGSRSAARRVERGTVATPVPVAFPALFGHLLDRAYFPFFFFFKVSDVFWYSARGNYVAFEIAEF